MQPDEIRRRGIEKEFIFSAVRSSGPGGQNVNKVSSKVELRFNLWKSACLSSMEKQLIYSKLANRINQKGELILDSQSERTQLRNKETVVKKFFLLIAKTLSIPKNRKATRPTKASKLRRLESKKRHASIKSLRKRPDL